MDHRPKKKYFSSFNLLSSYFADSLSTINFSFTTRVAPRDISVPQLMHRRGSTSYIFQIISSRIFYDGNSKCVKIVINYFYLYCVEWECPALPEAFIFYIKDLNSSKLNPLCLIIARKVPFANSLWFGIVNLR